MPTYVYKCPKCKSEVEMVRSLKDHEQAKPACFADGCDGQETMETQLFPVGVQFKGAGWTPKSSDSFGAPTDILHSKKR